MDKYMYGVAFSELLGQDDPCTIRLKIFEDGFIADQTTGLVAMKLGDDVVAQQL